MLGMNIGKVIFNLFLLPFCYNIISFGACRFLGDDDLTFLIVENHDDLAISIPKCHVVISEILLGYLCDIRNVQSLK